MLITDFIKESLPATLKNENNVVKPAEIYCKYGEDVVKILTEYLNSDSYITYEKDTAGYEIVKDALCQKAPIKQYTVDGEHLAVYTDENVGYVIDFDNLFLHNAV